MTAFTDSELGYPRGEPRLGRLATVGKDGTPHVAPVGWSFNAELDTIDIGASSPSPRSTATSSAAAGRRSSSTT